jgi:hypothetical protein
MDIRIPAAEEVECRNHAASEEARSKAEIDEARRLDDNNRNMPADDQDYPIIPHEDVEKVNCCGCLYVQFRGGEADISCNECGVVVRTVPVEQAGAVMVGLASHEICSVRCPHCQALNTFPGFSAIEAFICSECGEGVAVNRLVQ